MPTKPIFPFPLVGEHLVDFVPEGVRVIAVVKVTKLVDHDVVDDTGRSHQALPVEIERSGDATAGPAVTHLLDLDGAGIDADLRSIEGHAGSETLLALLNIEILEGFPGSGRVLLLNAGTLKAKRPVLEFQRAVLA